MHNLVASILISSNPNHIAIAIASPYTECANTVAHDTNPPQENFYSC